MAKKSSSGKSSTKTNVKRVAKAVGKYDTSKDVMENSDAIADIVVATATSAKRSKTKKQRTIFIVLLVLVIVAIVATLIYGYYHGWFDAILGRNQNPDGGNGGNGGIGGNGGNGGNGSGSGDTIADMKIHFIDLGSNSGDSIYIKAGDTDILIDAGSVAASAETIKNYVDQYCTDGKLEYVIATHADSDHIAAFLGTTKIKGILDVYECETIIRFAKTDKSTNVVTNFLAKCDEKKAAGSNYYTALDCYNNENGGERVYNIANGITMEVLYHDYYMQHHSDENNYSVCLLFTQGDNHYLFTGDLEKSGEESLIARNPNLPHVELYKAGHHGSATSSNDVLLNAINPQYVVASCAAGDKYNFPTQAFIDRVAPFTDNVYITGVSTPGYVMNGNVVFSCVNNEITLQFANNDLKLKDTEWFKNNRNCPSAWSN